MTASLISMTLNPLPSSVLVPASLFTGKLVSQWKVDQPTLDHWPVWFGATGDLTGDGYPEVVLTGWTGIGPAGVPDPPVYVVSTGPTTDRILTSAQLQGFPSAITGSSTPRIADLDHNGLNDFFFLAHSENPFTPETSYVYLQQSPGQFVAHPIAGPNLVSHNSTVGDFNGDGNLDIMAAGIRMDSGYFDPQFFNGADILYLGDGAGNFVPYAMLYSAPASVAANPGSTTVYSFSEGSCGAVADFDNDGKMDVVLVDANFQRIGDHSTPPRNDIMLVSDITLGNHEAWGNVSYVAAPYFEDKPQFAQYPSFLGDEKSHDIKVVPMDIDHDGLMDMLVSEIVWSPDGQTEGGVLQVLHNKGNLQFEDITDTALENFFLGKGTGHELYVLDVNGDGFPDIYMPETGNNGSDGTQANSWANQLLINTGDGHFVQAMWTEFHQLTGEESALIPSSQYMVPKDTKYNLYQLPDGTIGFIKTEPVYVNANETDFTVFDFRASGPLSTGPGGSDPALQGAPGFSEDYYLTRYPDVAAAVQAGQYASGLAQYLAVGRAAGLYAFAPNATIHGSAAADVMQGREGNETLLAGAGNDTIIATAGNDTVDGGQGRDTMKFTGSLFTYTVEHEADGLHVKNASIDDTLQNVERLQFSDRALAFDLDGAAGSVVRLLGAIFGPQYAQQPDWVSIGLSYADQGMSESAMAALALQAQLGAHATNAQVVSLLYQNVAGIAATQAAIDQYSQLITSGQYTQAQLAVMASGQSLNLDHIGFAQLVAQGVQYMP